MLLHLKHTYAKNIPQTIYILLVNYYHNSVIGQYIVLTNNERNINAYKFNKSNKLQILFSYIVSSFRIYFFNFNFLLYVYENNYQDLNRNLKGSIYF